MGAVLDKVITLLGRDVVACAYGDAVGAGGATAFWTLDEDARAAFSHAPDTVFAPLCRGLEMAVRRMTVGEVADVTILVPDLCFVRPPKAATPPTDRRVRDVEAFHYGGAGGANDSIADARCYSAPLEARLELVSVARRGEGALATAFFDETARATAQLDLADECKRMGSAHYARGMFGRASRRYTAALRHAADAADALAVDRAGPSEYDPEAPSRFIHDEAMKEAHRACETTGDPIDFDEGFPKPKSPTPEPSRRKPRKPTARQAATLAASDRCDKLLRDCRLNRAASDLKRCEVQRVCEDCSKVLEKAPNDLKALYRGGLAQGSTRVRTSHL